MLLLIANLGSTSFKSRLLDMARTPPAELAVCAVERIGDAASKAVVTVGEHGDTFTGPIPDHAAAMRHCFDRLTDAEHGCLEHVGDVAAVGFKAVHAGDLSGVRVVDDVLLDRMDELGDVAPAHNPPYAAAMRTLRAAFPDLPLVAAFETDFHATIPPEHGTYAVPAEWTALGVRRWGFHGASHRYVAERLAEITGRDDLRLVSCHLGGSSSLCAVHAGRSVAATMGMSPQSGLPQNNRVGDFDPFALPYLMRATGGSLDELLADLSTRSGLLGVSGLSGDVRDLEAAAADGHAGATLAIDLFVAETRRHLGGLLALLGGADAVAFTGGIGTHGESIRRRVCDRMGWAGIELDPAKNAAVTGEGPISFDNTRVQVWVVPTNEELIVARQVADVVGGRGTRDEG